MEYANGGSLQSYLKENFDNLTWEDKFKLAYQLACAVLCLHKEGIVHRDLVIISYHSYFICDYFIKLFNNIMFCLMVYVISIPVIY